MNLKRLLAVWKSPMPFWVGIFMLAAGMFDGTWMEARAFARHLGTSLSWQQDVIYAAPLMATFGWMMACLNWWKKRRAVPA